mmetsp:Transcript_1555/g.2855  ORF Transcript_1555/g.2855 Transcript_1555/m.2855 type:complete len:99 (+) Transcript_1555:135-431(+)
MGMHTPMPFNPLHEVRIALGENGFYPSVKVHRELLPSLREPSKNSNSSIDTNENIAVQNEESNNYMSEDSDGSDDDGIDDESAVAGPLSIPSVIGNFY